MTSLRVADPVHAPNVVVPRVSMANPLPAPAVAALIAQWPDVIADHASGVRRLPRPEGELDALSRLVQEGKLRHALVPGWETRPRPPPPPSRGRSGSSLAPRPPRLPSLVADSQQNAREPTYAHVEVLASYVVPTLSAQARAGTRRKGAPRPVLVLAFAALTGLVAAGMCGGSFVP